MKMESKISILTSTVPMNNFRLIWCCLLIACASYMIYTVSTELRTYYTYPSFTSVGIESHMKLEFPSVTLCNLNSLSKKAMKNDSRTDNYYLGLGPPAFEHDVKTIDWSDQFYEENGYFKSRNITDVLSESKELHNGITNLAFDQAAIDKDAYFSTILTPEGPCLTSNFNKTVLTSRVGPEFNLLVWLHINMDDNYFGSWLGEGVKVFIHDKNEDPFFNGPSGFHVEPGHEYYAAVKQKTYKYLPSPFKAMADSYCTETSTDGAAYVFTQCWKECYVNVLYRNCSCLDFQYKGHKQTPLHGQIRDYPICSKYAHFTCVKTLKGMLNIELEKICDCPMACESINYDVSLSSSLFPSSSYIDYLHKQDPYITHDYLRNNFIVLHIYFDELKTTKVTQSPKYSSPGEIFGNIGGQFGLFMGASILTMTELLEFVIFLLLCGIKKRGERKKVKQGKADIY